MKARLLDLQYIYTHLHNRLRKTGAHEPLQALPVLLLAILFRDDAEYLKYWNSARCTWIA